MTSARRPPAGPFRPEFAEAFAKAKHRHSQPEGTRFLHYDRARNLPSEPRRASWSRACPSMSGTLALRRRRRTHWPSATRYPNGRLKPLTAAQKRKQKLQEVAAAEIANVASVAAQPHRRDLPVSPLAGSASGRLILDAICRRTSTPPRRIRKAPARLEMKPLEAHAGRQAQRRRADRSGPAVTALASPASARGNYRNRSNKSLKYAAGQGEARRARSANPRWRAGTSGPLSPRRG